MEITVNIWLLDIPTETLSELIPSKISQTLFWIFHDIKYHKLFVLHLLVIYVRGNMDTQGAWLWTPALP